MIAPGALAIAVTSVWVVLTVCAGLVISLVPCMMSLSKVNRVPDPGVRSNTAIGRLAPPTCDQLVVWPLKIDWTCARVRLVTPAPELTTTAKRTMATGWSTMVLASTPWTSVAGMSLSPMSTVPAAALVTPVDELVAATVMVEPGHLAWYWSAAFWISALIAEEPSALIEPVAQVATAVGVATWAVAAGPLLLLVESPQAATVSIDATTAPTPRQRDRTMCPLSFRRVT